MSEHTVVCEARETHLKHESNISKCEMRRPVMWRTADKNTNETRSENEIVNENPNLLYSDIPLLILMDKRAVG